MLTVHGEKTTAKRLAQHIIARAIDDCRYAISENEGVERCTEREWELVDAQLNRIAARLLRQLHYTPGT